MKKVELLSPAGNEEMAHIAIHNGADAIYLAGKSYGARKYAQNFNDEQLKNIIKYAHLYNVKVYVTVNTIIYEEELSNVLEYVEFLYINQVDALIMQDIGLITLVRKYYPNLEIHASTQCHNHNKSGLTLWKELGLKRVVLDRELTKDEINNLNIDIEKEAFIYGALCVCYSGCCLFSSLNGGRSGNRGECVGCCRLPYKLNNQQEAKYHLSTKELNTLDDLDELLESNIDSFKIEGRMKSTAYVGYITKCTRKIIDSYYQGKKEYLSKEEKSNLMKLYNRGFTKGYILGEKNIINSETPNHQGIEIGKIIEIKKDKVKLKITNDYLNQQDGIRFKNSNKGMIVNKLYNDKLLLVNRIDKGNICYINKIDNLKKDDPVLKTTDHQLIKEIENYEPKKISISMKVTCKINKPLKIEITDNEFTIIKTKDIVEKSTKTETTKEDIISKLNKLGNTPYKLDKIIIEKDNNIFIRLSTLNELRRELTDELSRKRENKQIHEVIINKRKNNNTILPIPTNKKYISILVRNESQLIIALKYNINRIYTTNKNLYNKYKNKYNIYYKVERVNIKEPTYKNENLLTGDLGSTYLYSKNNNVIADYYLNIVNHATIDYLDSLNIKYLTLSVELNDNQIENIINNTNKVDKLEIIIYGNIELMILKHKLEKENNILINKQGNKYKTIEENNLTHIFNHEKINNIDKINYYQKLGIKNYRIELLDETPQEIEIILKKLLP